MSLTISKSSYFAELQKKLLGIPKCWLSRERKTVVPQEQPSEKGENQQKPPGGVLPKKIGRGVRPASQNPYPIYE